MRKLHRIAIVVLPLLCAAGTVRAQNAAMQTLPLLRVDTHGQVIPDEPKIGATLEIGARNGAGDSLLHAGFIGIELRGASTLALRYRSA